MTKRYDTNGHDIVELSTGRVVGNWGYDIMNFKNGGGIHRITIGNRTWHADNVLESINW